jgi:hypothetical protein
MHDKWARNGNRNSRKGKNWLQFNVGKRVRFMCCHKVQLHRNHPPSPSYQMILIEWGTVMQYKRLPTGNVHRKVLVVQIVKIPFQMFRIPLLLRVWRCLRSRSDRQRNRGIMFASVMAIRDRCAGLWCVTPCHSTDSQLVTKPGNELRASIMQSIGTQLFHIFTLTPIIYFRDLTHNFYSSLP